MDLEHTPNQLGAYDHYTHETTSNIRPSHNEPLPVAAPHALEADNPGEDFICRECRQVDWDSLPVLAKSLQAEHGDKDRARKTLPANPVQLPTSSCKICRILSVVKPRPLDLTECFVIAQSLSRISSYALDHDWPSRMITALHLDPKAYMEKYSICNSRCLVAIRRDSEDLSSRMTSPRSIDYAWLRSLAQSCEESHKQCCRRGPLDPVSVPGLKVIKVSSRAVIEAPPDCRYVAISYVWGKEPDVGLKPDLQRPPRLIEDAMSVTINMGYEYLWVDKYCIEQNDDQERYNMIYKMDQIYSDASLTIIDASGGDPHSGLPRVSSLACRPQECVHIGNTALLELPCDALEVKSSKWATRGWTYQEGFFSPRRIIFTPSQVLFLCNRTYREESVCRLLQQDTPENRNIPGIFHALIPGDRDRLTPAFIPHVEEYSIRDLTFATDSLNAFLGVLNFFTRGLRSLEVPFLHVSWGIIAHTRPKMGQLHVYLNWYHEAPAERRPACPSWAWTGWGGPVKFQSEFEGITLYEDSSDSHRLRHLNWEISWESKGGKTVTIWEFANDSGSTSYTGKPQVHQQRDYPSRLKITCFVVPVGFQTVPLTEAQRIQRTQPVFGDARDYTGVERTTLIWRKLLLLQMWKGIYITAAAYLDRNLDAQDCVIGLLYADQWGGGMVFVNCLLARKLDGGFYERVGFISRLLVYHPKGCGDPFIHLQWNVFLDETGRVLKKAEVSATQMTLPFDGVGERRTVVLK